MGVTESNGESYRKRWQELSYDSRSINIVYKETIRMGFGGIVIEECSLGLRAFSRGMGAIVERVVFRQTMDVREPTAHRSISERLGLVVLAIPLPGLRISKLRRAFLVSLKD